MACSACPHEPLLESTCFHSRQSIGSHSPKHLLESCSYRGRVAQLGEHLLCKHAFISPKSLNRRLLTVQTPLLVGLLIGLQVIRIRIRCPSWTNTSKNGLDSSSANTTGRTTRACFLQSPDASVVLSNPGRLRNHSGRLRRQSRSAKRGSERKGSQSGSTSTLARKRKERSS